MITMYNATLLSFIYSRRHRLGNNCKSFAQNRKIFGALFLSSYYRRRRQARQTRQTIVVVVFGNNNQKDGEGNTVI